MMETQVSVIFLPGAGNHPVDLKAFQVDGVGSVDTVWYPAWQRHAAGGLSAEELIADLSSQVQAKVPTGPICLVGLSLGGHLGYATALHLQALGREIAGFCAIDSFMVHTDQPTEGWKGRALEQGWEILRTRPFPEFVEFLRSKLWRLLIRLGFGRALSLLSTFKPSSNESGLSAIDPILEGELSMRHLLRSLNPWLTSLDHDPRPLCVPAALFRTRLTAADDQSWIRRCPDLFIQELPGHHHNLFEAENVGALTSAFAGWVRYLQSDIRHSAAGNSSPRVAA